MRQRDRGAAGRPGRLDEPDRRAVARVGAQVTPDATGLPAAFTVCTSTSRAGSTASSDAVAGRSPGDGSAATARSGVLNACPRAGRYASRQSPGSPTSA